MESTETPIQVIDFSSRHRESFRQLNEHWITEHFSLEDLDRKMLSDPENYILANGGYIFMALYDNEVVGTCALIRITNLTFELAKMAVAPNFRGKGIGLVLGQHCIEIAKQKGIRMIELLSNTKLEPAIRLYKRLGFTEVALSQTEYKRANIKMQMDLQVIVKASIVVVDDLPTGLAMNATALVTTVLGNRLSHLIGEPVLDASGGIHSGLTWLPMSVLKADRETLGRIRKEGLSKNLIVIDIPEHAQAAHVYEDFSNRMAHSNEWDIRYLAIGVFGDRKKVKSLTQNLPLYK